MATLVIPTDSEFDSFDFSVDLDGVTYTIDMSFNRRANLWMTSLWDSERDNLILGQIPALSGISLFYNYANAEIPPGEMLFIDETGQGRNPDRDNLGTDIKMIYIEALSP